MTRTRFVIPEIPQAVARGIIRDPEIYDYRLDPAVNP